VIRTRDGLAVASPVSRSRVTVKEKQVIVVTVPLWFVLPVLAAVPSVARPADQAIRRLGSWIPAWPLLERFGWGLVLASVAGVLVGASTLLVLWRASDGPRRKSPDELVERKR